MAHSWIRCGRFVAIISALVVSGVSLWSLPSAIQEVGAAPERFNPIIALATSNNAYDQAVQSYQRGEFSEALVMLRQAQSQDPSNANVRYYLALCLDKLVRYHEAVLQYRYVADHGQDPQVVDYSKYRLKTLADRMNPPESISKPVAFLNNSTHPSKAVRDAEVISTTASSQDVSIVPLKKNTQALMVEATLNNHTSGTFILDTGATYTSISTEMAESLGLDLENAPKVRITTANGRIEVPKVTIERLNVNGLEAHDVEATVIDIRKGSSFSGLLGLSFIKKFKLTIDPQAGQLIFQQN